MARCVEVYVYTWLGVHVHPAGKGGPVNDLVTLATTDLSAQVNIPVYL